MTTPTTLLDPTPENRPDRRERVSPPPSLQGLTVGMLDISKLRGDIFFDRLSQHVTKRGATVARYIKPTFTTAAPVALTQTISTECDVVIEAVAD